MTVEKLTKKKKVRVIRAVKTVMVHDSSDEVLYLHLW